MPGWKPAGMASVMRIGIGVFIAGLVLAAAAFAQPSSVAELRRGFENPPDDARIMMRWWWFGPAVTKPELEREMRLMKAGGIGGFEVQPVYPLQLDGNLPYLSPAFLDDLTFVGEKARELGMRLDLTLCSGWPYGGPHTPIELASAKLRVDRSGDPKIGPGEKLITQQTVNGVTLSFISSRTGQKVKRAAVGAEGYVLDHYSRAAIENHLKYVGEPLLKALAKTPPYAVFSDSLEVYGADWTPNFLEEFRRRRGYDLTPYLAALAMDIGPKTADIRHDWGETLTELADENYLTPIREWAAQHGTRFRSQTYGIPPVTLSSNALVDLPEGEGWRWRQFSATRWASSASHLYGRPVTSSETWTWLHSPVFRATPLDMKAEADLHFLEGVNQMVGHGWPYSSPEAGEPGWHFYAAAVFNQHNPWWIAMPDITRYLQRVSWLLRQGKPANDVSVYLPTDDAWAGFTLGHDSVNQAMDRLLGPDLIPQILDAGYNFDFIDDAAIGKVGVPYRIVVLPHFKRMPAGTKAKLDAFQRAGGHVVEDGADLGARLKAVLPPDLAAAPEIGFVHRKLPFAEVYFVANTSNHAVKTRAAFRVSGMKGQAWNPVTGEVVPGDGSELDLAPYESRVFVFSRAASPYGQAKGLSHLLADLGSEWRWPDEYFSGTQTYEKTVAVPATGREFYLSFGEGTPVTTDERRAGNSFRAMLESPVREAAVVYVNGKRAGAVWCAPYEVNITPFVKAGENQIRIVVANLAINELAKLPRLDYTALIAKYGRRFDDQDFDKIRPEPAGIRGDVKLISR